MLQWKDLKVMLMTKLLFMGRKKVASRLLRYFFQIKNIDIVGVLTEDCLYGSDIEKVANELNIPLFTYDKAIKLIKSGELFYELGVSILYWKRLKDELLYTPRKGVINFHPAPLPEYKGTGGYNLAILESKTSWAVTAHYMNDGIDTGRIIECKEFPIDLESETVASLEKKSMIEIEEIAKIIIKRAVNEESYLPSVENKGGRYISRSEMESLKEVVLGDDVDRKIRAFWYPPYNGAFIEFNNKKYTLINQEILDDIALPNFDDIFLKKEQSL